MSISVPNVSHREGNTILPGGPVVVNNLNGLRPITRAAPLFRDYGKAANELYTKGFAANYRFEVNTAPENGLKFSFAAERRHTKDADNIFVSSQIKFEQPSSGVNFIGTIDSEKLEGDFSVNNIASSGVKLQLKGKFLDNDRTEASAEGVYANSSSSAALGLFVKDDRPRVEAQASSLVVDNLSLGALVSYYLPGSREGAVDNFQLGANYAVRALDFSTVLRGARNDKLGTDFNYSVGSRVLYNVNLSTTFAADVNHVIGKGFRDLDLKLTGQHKFDLNTTGKLSVERSGKARLALAHKVQANTTLTVGAEVNALRVEEHSVGLLLSFTG